jgi:hypothetical protein
MVLHRREGEPGLSHHLKPTVERRVRFAPLLERQCWPGIVTGDGVWHGQQGLGLGARG